ncbi:Wzz/FepE/Etk N-terminal domain-containing protein [Desulfotalea psychrophila]|nr:Wzz/FepE/Etk N-terminal domain-containing protein [Desulfotalea psychrophila]
MQEDKTALLAREFRGRDKEQSPYFQNDEIDLLGLLHDIWDQRKFLMKIVLAVTLVAFLVLLVLPSTYQARMDIGQADSVALVVPVATGQDLLTRSYRFGIVSQYLKSFDSWVTFRQGNREGAFTDEELQGLQGEFVGLSVQVQAPKPIKGKAVSDPSVLRISYRGGGDNTSVEQRLTGFVLFVDKKAAAYVEQEMEVVIQKAGKEINNKIGLLRHAASVDRGNRITRLLAQQKKDLEQVDMEISALKASVLRSRAVRLTRLQENYAIAESLGIKLPTSMDNISERNVSNLKVMVTDQTAMPVYLLGTEVLAKRIQILREISDKKLYAQQLQPLLEKRELLLGSSELNGLRARKDDDAYIAELPGLLSRLQQLDAYTDDLQGVHALQVYSAATGSGHKIKPKKALILATTVLLSCFLAVALALLRTALQRRRESM